MDFRGGRDYKNDDRKFFWGVKEGFERDNWILENKKYWNNKSYFENWKKDWGGGWNIKNGK